MQGLPQPGSLLGGKYRVIRLLGEGGMGAVFEAEHNLTLKRVAVKWLHPAVARQEGSSARLIREALASARVRHPNVVDIYDVAEDRGAVFLVMEYLEGEALGDALARGDLRMHEVIALLLCAMRGVAAAHREGVVHRDIKPDNIFLARLKDVEVPVPKVLDFGIAKVDPRGHEQLTLTRTGSTIGTPLYMPYEQLVGEKDIDARADVYAFGVILYEALTGHVPYEASTLPELIVQIATVEPTPPKVRRPEIPTELAQLVESAMAKDRDQRLPDLDTMMQALEPFSTEAGFLARMTRVNMADTELSPAGPDAADPTGPDAFAATEHAGAGRGEARAGDTTQAASATAPGRVHSVQPHTPQAWQTDRVSLDAGRVPMRSTKRLLLLVASASAAVGVIAALVIPAAPPEDPQAEKGAQAPPPAETDTRPAPGEPSPPDRPERETEATQVAARKLTTTDAGSHFADDPAPPAHPSSAPARRPQRPGSRAGVGRAAVKPPASRAASEAAAPATSDGRPAATRRTDTPRARARARGPGTQEPSSAAPPALAAPAPAAARTPERVQGQAPARVPGPATGPAPRPAARPTPRPGPREEDHRFRVRKPTVDDF